MKLSVLPVIKDYNFQDDEKVNTTCHSQSDAFPKKLFGSAEDTKLLRNSSEKLWRPISSTVEIAIRLESLRGLAAHKSVFQQPASESRDVTGRSQFIHWTGCIVDKCIHQSLAGNGKTTNTIFTKNITHAGPSPPVKGNRALLGNITK